MRGCLPVWAVLLAAITSGCAARSHLWTGPLHTMGQDPPEAVAVHPGALGTMDLGQAIARAAITYLATPPIGYRRDCSGFVEAVLHRSGAGDLRGSTRDLWDWSVSEGLVHRRRRPQVGDLAFFDDTHDRNGNGRLDDDLTHVAVVIDVLPDGTAVLAHDGTSRGRSTMRMNLFHPDEIQLGTRRLNDPLRRNTSGDRSVPTLSGQLWRGFATFSRDAVALGG